MATSIHQQTPLNKNIFISPPKNNIFFKTCVKSCLFSSAFSRSGSFKSQFDWSATELRQRVGVVQNFKQMENKTIKIQEENNKSYKELCRYKDKHN